MRKERLYFIVFVFFQIIYAVRTAPYDLTSGLLLSVGVVFSLVYVKCELLSGNRKTND